MPSSNRKHSYPAAPENRGEPASGVRVSNRSSLEQQRALVDRLIDESIEKWSPLLTAEQLADARQTMRATFLEHVSDPRVLECYAQLGFELPEED